MYSYNVYLFREDTSHLFWYDFIELSNNTAYQEMKQQFITEGKLLSEEVSSGNDDTIYVRTLNFETETSCNEFVSAFFNLYPNYRKDFKEYLTKYNHTALTSINQEFLPAL